MKYPPSIYAKAFAEAAAEHRGAVEGANLVKNFLAVIEKNGDVAHLRTIVAQTGKAFRERTGTRNISIETAREGKKSPQELLKHFLKTSDSIEEKINPELIAGIKITVNGTEEFDGSLARKLNTLFSNS
jgi:F0F1-type ATP synthase delta subunit